MSSFRGFCELRSVHDLLLKLQQDIVRMVDDPGDEYAAFDFFVTAEHMTDWLYPDSHVERSALRQSDPLLQLTSHIANGAKHFAAKSTRHTSVESIDKERYVEPGYVEPDFFEESIVIRLSPTEVANFKCAQFDAVTLGYRVLEYWQRKLRSSGVT
jgi:hypothetical protein